MADPRAIHEFLTGEVEATTLILGDFLDMDAQSGYTTYKMSVSDLGEVILEDIEYTQELQTADKTIVGAINENKSVIGYSYDEYDATTSYSKDDLCIYNNTLYKALQATTGNLPTNTTYWEQTSIADEIASKADSADVDNNVVSITKINQSAYNLIATRRGHCVILAFDGALPSGTYGNIWQCSLKPTTSIRAVVAWGTSITLIDIDTDGIIGFRASKTITESTYLGGELVFVTPS